jgi:hypothetical protein
VLGLWAGKGGGESAKFWMNVLTDLKNRGVTDVFFIVCDGLKGLPDAVTTVFPAAIVQACVIHLIRATLRYASRKYWDQLAKDLRAIYTAPTVEAAWAAFEELEEKWGKPYPAISKLWRAAWEEFTPFRAYDVEIRRVLLHQRHRVAQRPLPPGRQRQGPLPDRAGRSEDAVPGHPLHGPQRHRAGTMDHAVEPRPERLRRHLRRPHAGRREPLEMNAGNTLHRTVPLNKDQRRAGKVRRGLAGGTVVDGGHWGGEDSRSGAGHSQLCWSVSGRSTREQAA